MPQQDPNGRLTDYQWKILDLEKFYFNTIKNIINNQGWFLYDLLLMEKEVRERYDAYRLMWGKKNKINISVERLIRHYVYTWLNNLITWVYPSAVSPDMWIRLNDVTIWIDAKTIDTNSNAWDLRSTHMEENQTSFNNREYPFIVNSRLESVDRYNNNKPILSYIIKIVYHDDGHTFWLERSERYPWMVLVCIPNWELSSLFWYNIIDNFKDYAYYSAATDWSYFAEKTFPIDSNDNGESYMDNLCAWLGFIKLPKETYNKLAYYDPTRQLTRREVKKKTWSILACVKSWNTVRYNNDILKNRFDSHGNPRHGYEEYRIPDALR